MHSYKAELRCDARNNIRTFVVLDDGWAFQITSGKLSGFTAAEFIARWGIEETLTTCSALHAKIYSDQRTEPTRTFKAFVKWLYQCDKEGFTKTWTIDTHHRSSPGKELKRYTKSEQVMPF